MLTVPEAKLSEFVTFIVTGNYRVGFAAIFLSTKTLTMQMRVVFNSFLYNSILPFGLMTILIPKSILFHLILIIFIHVVLNNFSYYFNFLLFKDTDQRLLSLRI